MTTDRLERRLPDVLTELALPRVPDYFDDLLDRTARMPQRPGWTFLERWFPMSTLTATLSSRRLSLRPLAVIAILIALVIASIAFLVGTQHHPAPLLGLARNGAVVTTGATGDLVAVDPDTGVQHTLIAGPNLCCVSVSRDGQRLAMLRVAPGSGDATGLAVANADGSGVREFPKELIDRSLSFEWSAQGDRILITNKASAVVLDVESGTTTTIPSSSLVRASWIGTSGDILMTSLVADTQPNGLTLSIDRVTPGLASRTTRVATLDNAVDAPLVSPDGSKFLYFIWGGEARLHGDLHVFDLAAGTDTALTDEVVDDGQMWESPVWSSDGSAIAAELYGSNDLYRIAIIPAAGGTPVLVGPTKPSGTNGAAVRFSPDGQSLLVTYRFDNTTWLLPISGAAARQVPWATTDDMDWQRLAP